MSKENLLEFANFVQLPANEAIEAELWDITCKEQFIQRSVDLGKEHGYEFTIQEMEAWLDELDQRKKEETGNPDAKITYPVKDMERTYVVTFF